MVDIVQQVSTDIVLSDKSEAEAGTNNTKFMTPLRTKEAIDKNLVPFSAMSQSQFEAIRAANNEEFAASGFVHFGKQHVSAATNGVVNQGLSTFHSDNSVANIFAIGKKGSITGTSKTDYPTVNIAGVTIDIDSMNTGVYSANNYGFVKFPQAPDGKTTYNKSTGAIVTHVDSTTAFAAQAADPTNVEVVINRVDMWGFEAWLEEVNSTNPFVYPNGLIQSQATAMDGINTSASARPVTYYAVFDGDTGSKGKGVNFFTLTDAQKKKVLGNHKNNLYYLDDGRLVQWRLRQRSFAGAGNGDWGVISANPLDTSLRFRAQGEVEVAVQGNANSVSTFNSGWGDQNGSFTSAYWKAPVSSKGIYSANYKNGLTPASVNGECYFLVCGTVNRLNQGFYHPSLNANGSAKALGDTFWYNTAQSFTTTADCFNPAKLLTGSGSIASGKSGRPDNRYFDAVYDSGFGGVCRDMRYSANGLTPTDFADADQRVKNGTYRGFEKAVFTKIVQESYPLDTVNTAHFIRDPDVFKGNALSKTALKVGGYFYKYFNGVLYSSKITNLVQEAGGDQLAIYTVDLLPRNAGTLTVLPVFMESQVGGSFLQTDVIGNPANILATPQLANGWQGSWGGLSSGGGVSKSGTRKMIASGLLTYSSDNGATWGTGQLPQPNAENVVTSTYGETEIRICQYQAFAKQTKPSANAVVYGGQSGVGDVFASSFYDKSSAALCESLISKVPTNGKHVAFKTYKLTSLDFVVDKIHSYAPYYIPAHNTLDLAQPENNSPAFKALNYNVAVNQQGFINYAYTELKHNGTNWGDDGKVTIVDNQSTKTDLNGNTVLVGTAQTCESLGWIKNKL